MIKSNQSVVFTVIRRSLFLLALTFNGAISVSLFHFIQKTTNTGLSPIGILAWGMNASGHVLGIWLATRQGIWSTWNGIARIAIFVTASAYGRMLFSATQEWWIASSIRLPGSKVLDYHWAASDLLIVMIFALLLRPMVSLSGITLTSANDVDQSVNRVSITSLLVYMTFVGIALVWVKFLGADIWPQNQLGGLSQYKVFKRWLGEYLPFAIPPIVAAYVMLLGFTRRWSIAIGFVFAAIALDMIGVGIVGSFAEQMTGERKGGIVGSNEVHRWYYVCGRSITVAAALSIARLLGVQPIFGSRVTAGNETKTADATPFG